MEYIFSKHLRVLNTLKTTFRNAIIDDLPWQERLIGIVGPRGVGKTTMLLQYIKETYKNDKTVLYFSFDDILFVYDSLLDLVEKFVKQGGKHLFIDEIHKYPNWSQELKNIYDTFPELKVVFTGSSILDIHKGKADLSRRALVFEMQGLSFREFLQIETKQKLAKYSLTDILKNHEEIAISIFKKLKPFQYFEDYLRYGYYPFYLQNKDYYTMRLSSTINQIVELDLPMIKNVEIQYVSKIKRILNILSNEIPFKPNITRLAGAVETSWQTVIKYLNYLDKAKIINIVYPATKNVSTLSKPEKIFLHHPNVYFVFNKEINNKGNLRETFFVNQLSYMHKIEIPKKGDFLIDKKYTFEIGGKKKSYQQIADIKNSYIASDDIEFGYNNKIPLWLFGFLY